MKSTSGPRVTHVTYLVQKSKQPAQFGSLLIIVGCPRVAGLPSALRYIKCRPCTLQLISSFYAVMEGRIIASCITQLRMEVAAREMYEG